MTPSARTGSRTGREKSVSRKHRGVNRRPAASWPRKQEEIASAFLPVFIIKTPA